MRGQVQKDLFLENLIHASKFTSSRLGQVSGLQGVYCVLSKGLLHMYATNLNTSYAVTLAVEFDKETSFLMEASKIIEFFSYLESGGVDFYIEKDRVVFSQGKTKGSFPFLTSNDFPVPVAPPQDGGVVIELKAFENMVAKVLFAASRDLSRPVLSGVRFVEKEGLTDIVATDGFRLSLFTLKNDVGMPSMLIPAEFIVDFLRSSRDKKKMTIHFLDEQKMVVFVVEGEVYYSRMIDGEFPPYERVIPSEKKTEIIIDREELIKKIKIISVFARDHSSIIVCEFKKNELTVYPKIDGGVENSTSVECLVEGEPMRVAFNFKFLLEFLNSMEKKDVQIQLLRPDAPVVLRQKGDNNYTHIIMPVRIQE